MKRIPPLVALVAFSLAWLAIPDVALADNCSDWSRDEIASCPSYAILKVLGFVIGGMLSGAIFIFNRYRDNLDDTRRFLRWFFGDPSAVTPPSHSYHRSSPDPDSDDDPPPGVRRRDYE